MGLPFLKLDSFFFPLGLLLWDISSESSIRKGIPNANIKLELGLPWWLSGKESACQCKRYGFDP